MARYTRDEILAQGLELASSPTVTQHDMPGGVIQANAYSIKWLQNALDMFHRKYPFASDLQDVGISLGANQEDITITSTGASLPSDFILDVRNGVLISFNSRSYRLWRKSFQYFLSFKLSYQNSNVQAPWCYAVIQNKIKVSPMPSAALSGTLWYYKLAQALEPTTVPNFPDEWTLIEFIRLKALEWTRSLDIGTAQLYMQKELSRLRSSGLLNEPEYEDAIPIENNQIFTDALYDRNAWMGGFPQSGL